MVVHIIGAGLAGLSAAVQLTKSGASVRIHEATPRAGGRCRSYHDAQLGCVIDNGNHLLMSGNTAAMAYLDLIGSRDQLAGAAVAAFPFFDVMNGQRWTVRPNRGRIPWWILNERRRVPGTTPAAYLSVFKLLKAQPGDTVADLISPSSPLFRTFWEPLTIAALNTPPERAAAVLMRPVLTETFLKGGDACRPLIARTSLAEALIDPAVEYLQRHGANLRFGCRVRAIRFSGRAIVQLETEDGEINLQTNDIVILAVPPWIAQTLVPGLSAPPPGETIVNVHYRISRTAEENEQVQVIGIVGGLAQWLFLHGQLASVTISAATAVAEEDAATISRKCWHEVARALGNESLPEPASRVIKEKRATFAQTPHGIRNRPPTRTDYANLLLAGDWTDTGLPATIEGALRSGVAAAAAAADALNSLGSKAA